MLKVFLFFLFLIGVGALAIWRGKQMIRNKFALNSRKSAKYTGVTHIKGDAAVKTGKMNVILGWAFCGIGVLGALGVGAVGIMLSFQSPTTSSSSSNETVNYRDNAGDNTSDNGSNDRSTSTPRTPSRSARRPSTGGFDNSNTRKMRGQNTRSHIEKRNREANEDREAEREAERSGFAAGSPNSDSNDIDSGTDTLIEEMKSAVGQDGEVDVEKAMELAQSAMKDRNSRRSSGRRGSGRTGGFGMPVKEALPDLDSPEVAFPETSFEVKRIQKSDLIGFRITDTTVEGEKESGNILVGLDVAFDDDFDDRLMSIQPIYQQQDEYQLGKRIGESGGVTTRLLAPAGFAVCGIEIESGTNVTALRLLFMKLGSMKLGSNGRLEKDSQTETEWVGKFKDSELSQGIINGQGDPIVSVFAGINNDEIVSIGLMATKRLAVESKNADTDTVDAGSTNSGGIRDWKSANGKHTLEAEYISHSGNEVKLKKKDNEVITVAIDQLGKDEQKWIKSRR